MATFKFVTVRLGKDSIPDIQRICSSEAGILENTYKITVGEMLHPMDEDHYIMWIMVSNEKEEFFHYLVPGEVPIVELPIIPNATVYAYCNKHGLFSKKID